MSLPVTFGPYELVQRLAVGGTAEILLATRRGPEQFRKRLVIKRLHEHLAAEPAVVEMFLDEAKLLVSLDHPGLVRVLELTQIDGHHCIVMEYLEGRSVAKIVSVAAARGVDIPSEFCGFILSNACQAVAYAHNHHDDDGNPFEIIHRDLSASNIVVTRQGDVKVIDFGIAKHAGAAPTRAGVIKGSSAYMSPEQARGETLDPRTDIFSLGMVLLELLTLSKQHTDVKDPDDATRAIDLRGAMTQVPESVETETIPAMLRVLLRWMLQPDRERRPKKLEMVTSDLESYLAETERPFASHLARFLEQELSDDPTVVDSMDSLATLSCHEVSVHGTLADPTRVIHPDDLTTLQTWRPGVLEPTLVTKTPAAAMETVIDHESVQSGSRASATDGTRRWPWRLIVVGLTVSCALAAILMVVTKQRSPTPLTIVSEVASETTGSITVDTDPSGIDVDIDGQISGARSPLTVTGVLPGSHLVTVTAPGGEPQSMRVEVKRGQDAALFFSLGTIQQAANRDSTAENELEPVAGTPRREVDATAVAAPETRKLTKTERPALRGAYVIESTPRLAVVDGKRSLGVTPLKQQDVKPGRHRLSLVSQEHGLRKSVVVHVKAGEVSYKNIVLKRGKVRFSVVPWADVFIGKKKLGTTPMPPVALFEGSYLITLRNPRLGAKKTVQVTVKAGDTVVVSASLE